VPKTKDLYKIVLFPHPINDPVRLNNELPTVVLPTLRD
jgi:hypothetical protein